MSSAFMLLHEGLHQAMAPDTSGQSMAGKQCENETKPWLLVYADGTLYLAETDSSVASLWEVPLPA